MKDLIRDFKMVAKRREESDTESQPLLSSHSSASSFGATRNACMFPEYDTTDCEECEKTVEVALSPATSSPFHSRNNFCFRRRSNYDSPALDVYTAEEEIYDRWPYFTKVQGVLARRPSSLIQKSSGNSSYHDIAGLKTQSSLVTIFAIWNTTMGSSLLAMPWGIERAGLFPGILINILVAGMCLYTCYVLLKVNDSYGLLGLNNEVSDLCRLLIGRWAESVAKIFSIIVLTGSSIVYWVLMSNFLYYSIYFLFSYIMSSSDTPFKTDTVICPREAISNLTVVNSVILSKEFSIFDKLWDLHSTVPIVLAVIMFPLLNFKSPTFFTKFNSLGTISVVFLLGFVATKTISWGINITDWTVEFNLKSSFCALSGMLSLSYFIHNIIISVMKNNRYQQNNGRDLTIAFSLVTFTYLFIGVAVYITFPLPKICIEDNILNNFEKYDTMTIIARLLLLFQLLTVFPLIAYMLRLDIFKNFTFLGNYSEDFSYFKVVVVNISVITVCILVACFFPKIGTLIRYTGALSGLVYIFLLPSLLKIASLRKEHALTGFKFIFYSIIVVFGFINVIAQLFISDQ